MSNQDSQSPQEVERIVTKINIPEITNYRNEDDMLLFTLKNTNVSIANGLRRTILSDVPTVVFRTSPYEKNLADFKINTSQLNNEILKQRLSCIPIHIVNDKFDINNLEIVVDKKNTTNDMMFVTTKDFKVKDLATDKFVTEEVRDAMFPQNKITGDHIIFARLRPKISSELLAEELSVHAKLTYGNAKESGAFNVVSVCTYQYTPDLVRQDEMMKDLFDDVEQGEQDKDIESEKLNWRNHDSERVFIKDSFDMKIKTVGVFKNEIIVKKACEIIVDKLKLIKKEIVDNELVVGKSISTIPNSFDIILKNEDYTIGKIIEYVLFKNYFQSGEISYSGFRKNHPHDPDSVIRIAFDESEIETTKIYNIIDNCCDIGIEIYNSIRKDIIIDV
tara:strand:+ start:1634 stop:2803 length:1170 start_codon:yes stop_codon:yes gene_type:complete